MALKKMKKTPTGWGTGYLGVDVVSCKKSSGITIKCRLITTETQRRVQYLTGTEIHFENIDFVQHKPRGESGGYMRGKHNPMACYVDSGIITCLPEKELK